MRLRDDLVYMFQVYGEIIVDDNKDFKYCRRMAGYIERRMVFL